MDGQAAVGRPRNEEIDVAVLAATRQLLRTDGYAKLSIEGVARTAGVSKASIYRRWCGKTELVLDAAFAPVQDLPSLAPIRKLLRGLIDMSVEQFSRPETRSAIPGLIDECLRDPSVFHEHTIGPEVELIAESLRLDRRGRDGRRADANLLFDLYVGAALMRTIRGEPLDASFRKRLLDWLARVASRGSSPGH